MALVQSPLAFKNYASTRTLERWAESPVDLTQNLTPERVKEFVAEGCGFKLFYATDRITADVMKALVALSQEAKALEKMEAMQNGEVLNKIDGFPSENRTVLHTAMRDFFESPATGKPAVAATADEKKELEKLQGFLSKVEGLTDVLMIGIGGSNLGPEAAYRALANYRIKGRRAHFFSNIDPDEIASIFQEIDPKKTLVLVVSKSGSTLETITNYEFVKRHFLGKGLDPKKHFVSITGEGSPLDNKEEFLDCFYSWDFIGGRYSTSAVYGAVLLSFTLGFDTFQEFLRGASAMDKVALKPDIKANLPLLLALLSIWNHNFLQIPTLAMIPYASALGRFPAHIQQVEMESNGKHIDRQGQPVDFQTAMVVWGEPGTNAQHSFFQMIHQGTQVISLDLIGFREPQYGVDELIGGTTNQEKLLSNLFAQAISLATGKKSDNPNKQFEGNRPSRVILGEKLTPYALGALFSLYENRVAFEGFIWDINSFDQEGVQLGKVLATQTIGSFEEIRKEGKVSGAFPLAETYIELIK